MCSWAILRRFGKIWQKSVLTGSSEPVVFNIKGHDSPLVVAVAYRFAALYIKFVGTHAEYDAINAATVENQP